MKLIQLKQKLKNSIKTIAGFFMVAAGTFLPIEAADSSGVVSELVNGTIVPKGVQDFVDSYLKDSTCSMCFTYSNKNLFRLDTTLKLADIEAGIPIHEYLLDEIKFLNSKDSVPISSVLTPIDNWYVPIRSKGKYLYIIQITKRNSNDLYHISEIDANCKDWEEINKLRPESQENIPILIEITHNKLFHYPKIDKYNLLMLSQEYKIPDSVSIAFTQSNGDSNDKYVSPKLKNKFYKHGTYPNGAYLSDSRRVFKIIKKRALKEYKMMNIKPQAN